MRRILLVGILALIWPQGARADTWAIQGTLLTPDQIIDNGVVVISGQKISAVGEKVVPPENAPLVKLHAVVLPGFIDLHDHLTWNVFPRWHPCRKFANRYEWQETPEYDRLMKTPQATLVADGLGCDADLFAEVKALSGGATSVVGSFGGRKDHPGENACISGLARNLDLNSDLSTDPPGTVVNEVFPFEVPLVKLDSYRTALANHTVKCLLIHLAEGSPTDASAHREFRVLVAQDLLRPGVVIIHGVALRADDFAAMHTANVGLIWSPRSNDELYGGTTNIPAALRAQATIAIAPDWSPTGSAGMLEELNYAAAKYTFFNAKDLVEMATSIPAKLAGQEKSIGQVASGLYADLVAIRAGNKSPYESVVSATPADVQLVVVGGQPIYGDPDLLKKLLPGRKLAMLTVCGTPKALFLGGSGADQLRESWNDIETHLDAELHRSGTRLGPFECN